MNQQPVTVTYSLEEILTRLEQKIENRFEQLEQKMESRFEQMESRFEQLEKKMESRFEQVEKKISDLQKDTSDIKVTLATLTEKVEGMDNRLKVVEGTQKNQVWTLIVLLTGAIATASAKLFGIIGNS
jgi:chromosome segregation ATPase